MTLLRSVTKFCVVAVDNWNLNAFNFTNHSILCSRANNFDVPVSRLFEFLFSCLDERPFSVAEPLFLGQTHSCLWIQGHCHCGRTRKPVSRHLVLAQTGLPISNNLPNSWYHFVSRLLQTFWNVSIRCFRSCLMYSPPKRCIKLSRIFGEQCEAAWDCFAIIALSTAESILIVKR